MTARLASAGASTAHLLLCASFVALRIHTALAMPGKREQTTTAQAQRSGGAVSGPACAPSLLSCLQHAVTFRRVFPDERRPPPCERFVRTPSPFIC